MKKLMASLACGAVLSMSLMGVGYADNAAGTAGMGGTTINGTGTNDGVTNMFRGNGTTYPTGTMRTNDNTMTGTGRTDNNVAPLNTTRTGTYRARNTTARTDNDNSNWGWLGLIGLLGLAGMRNRSGERGERR